MIIEISELFIRINSKQRQLERLDNKWLDHKIPVSFTDKISCLIAWFSDVCLERQLSQSMQNDGESIKNLQKLIEKLKNIPTMHHSSNSDGEHIIEFVTRPRNNEAQNSALPINHDEETELLTEY